MSLLKRKGNENVTTDAKTKVSRIAVYKTIINGFEKVRINDDSKVLEVFEEDAIQNSDKYILQNLTNFIEKGLLKGNFYFVLASVLNLTTIVVYCF